MKKILTVVISLLCLIVMLVSCVSHIEDTNGDDTSLCTLTDSDIINGTSSLSQKRVSNKRNDRGTIKVEKFSGVQTVDTINVRNSEEKVICTVTITSGNLRVVIVKDGKIFADIKTDGTEASVALAASGKYELKIAGESACFEMEYKIK